MYFKANLADNKDQVLYFCVPSHKELYDDDFVVTGTIDSTTSSLTFIDVKISNLENFQLEVLND
jgi:hypothetical protein